MERSSEWYRDRWYPGRKPIAARTQDPEVRFDHLPEALVQDIWKNCDFAAATLSTVAGHKVVVRDPGRINRNGGPDFLNAHLLIGAMEWVGDVEIHLTSEDWYRHGHQRNPRYNSVVLHVTLVADLWTGHVVREDGTTVPEVVLSRHLHTRLRTLLHGFRTRCEPSIPCAGEWETIPDEVTARAIARMSRMRLLRRANHAATVLRTGLSRNEVLYRSVFACLGYAKNEQPMRSLAERIPLETAWQINDLIDLEALYLGTAGLIPARDACDQTDRGHALALHKRYLRMEDRCNAQVMVATEWRFFRLRPSNFPPLRIAQGCALIKDGLLSREAFSSKGPWMASEDPKALLNTIEPYLRPTVRAFWKTHYRLERTSHPHSTRIGSERRRTIIINAVLPVLLAATDKSRRASMTRTCEGVLRLFPAEDDDLTRTFSIVGADLGTAADSQGVHELFRRRCADHGCIRCDIGRHILRSTQFV